MFYKHIMNMLRAMWNFSSVLLKFCTHIIDLPTKQMAVNFNNIKTRKPDKIANVGINEFDELEF